LFRAEGSVKGSVVYLMIKVVFFRIILMFTVGIVSVGLSIARAAVPVPPPVLEAMPITLMWNAADDPSVTGYAIYYGPTNRSTLNRIDAGSNTFATVFGMNANVVYRLYAVSYNAAGLESAPSNELLFQPPAISRLQLARQKDGSMRLSAKAAPGALCSVLFTPSLQPPTWQTLAQTTADEVGNVIALDTSASQANSRFYRVVLGAQPLMGELRIQRQSDGSMGLEGSAPPGALCTVLFTPTLNPPIWQPLAYASADQAGRVIAQDMSARQWPGRFYRLALGAPLLLGSLQIQSQANGDMLLSAKAPPGASCRLLYATVPNANSWQTLQTVIADADGNVTALDTTARQARSRFYRMAMP
jgi:hypothetical protein